MKSLLSLINFLAQTDAQKHATVAGVGVFAVTIMILLMGKSEFSGKLKILLMVLMLGLFGVFALLNYVVFK